MMVEGIDKASVLIVDHEPHRLLALEAALTGLPAEIVRARSGQQAQRQVLNREFALILLQVNMPGIDGLETARVLRDRKSSGRTPIILISDYADESIAARAYALGAVDYILAPGPADVLQAKAKTFIDLYLRNAESRREAEGLRVRSRQLGVLASQLVETEQFERGRLAKVLHDHVQQLLAAAMMRVQLAQQPSEQDGTVRSLAELEDLLDGAIKAARALSLELHPPVFNDGGLEAALEWLVRHMQKSYGLEVAIEGSSQSELPAPCRALAFDTARELLFNIVRHAGVSRARVRLADSGPERVRITIEDEGSGFDPETLDAVGDLQPRSGLARIRERLQILGGTVEVESSPNRGTRVAFEVPTLRPGIPELEREALGAASSKSSSKIRVLLVDDHAILREGLASLLQRYDDIEVVGEGEDGLVGVELAHRLHPDVVVMDLSMPRLNGIEATRRIAAELPGVRVVGLSMHEEEYGLSAMRRAGAVACVVKAGPPDDLVTAIRSAGA
jgi:DNA-binding NarL/FixJ family response regulator